VRRVVLLTVLIWSAACRTPAPAGGSYLFLWAGDSAGQASDFLAVIDADPASPRYGRVLTSIATGVAGTHPHHTEDVMPVDGHLLANGFGAGRTWLFDLSKPLEPRILTSFGDVAGWSHPHSFLRLVDGNVLATFQYRAAAPADTAGRSGPSPHLTGGLVRMDERGNPIRSAGAADTTIADRRIYPYAVLPIPALDRAVSTTTDMDEKNVEATSQWIQIWKLSDLTLLRTVALPPGPRGDEQQFTGEPRLLADGRSVYVHTFNCGLYLVRDVDQAAPAATFVYGFEGKNCGVPVVTGHYWLQTVPEVHALVGLDIADPEHPREVSRVTVGQDESPHWLAIDPGGHRLVMNSGGNARGDRLFLVDFDPATGRLAIDQRFKDPGDALPGLDLSHRTWPHGFAGRAEPHGTVFSR
jgi:hypothetical protein